jgi:hypothetical protein
MTTQKEVVTAFPCHGPSGQVFQYGMTLRDWFAGMALSGYLAGRNNMQAENPMNFERRRAAKDCYKYADAMLAARKEDA